MLVGEHQRGIDKISSWKKASFNERIVLSAAIAVVLNKELAGVKLIAKDIHDCVEEATRGLDAANNLTIAEVASLCVGQLKKM